MIRFSLTVPTCGRPSLYQTLHGAWTEGLTREDEVIVVGDGPQPEALRIVKFFEDRLNIRYVETQKTGCVGMAQRNYGMTLATGTHLTFMDDDDVYTPNAFRTIRMIVSKHPERIHIFRIRAVAKRLASWDVLWKDPEVKMCNVGSPTIVVPNVPEKLGRWPNEYEGDFRFIDATVKLFEQPPIFRKEIIADIR